MGHSDSIVTLKVYSHFIPDTFISRAILLELIQKKKISWMKYGNAWLIHTKQFFTAINPRGLEGNYETPKLRNRMSAVREWNKTHPYCLIDKHVVEACKQDERVLLQKG